MINLYGYNDYNGPACLLSDDQKFNARDGHHITNVGDEDEYNNPLQIGYWLEGDSLSPPCGTSISAIHTVLEYANVTSNNVMDEYA